MCPLLNFVFAVLVQLRFCLVLPPPLSAMSLPLPCGVLALVDTFLELSPGVPASEENLQKWLSLLRLQSLNLSDATETIAKPLLVITLHPGTRRLSGRLAFHLWESALKTGDSALDNFAPGHKTSVWMTTQPPTTAGLLEGILQSRGAKTMLRRGVCDRCNAMEPPRKKLKVAGFQSCLPCSLHLACSP
jgi:hypothetical protein